MKAIKIRRLLSKHNNMALFCLKSGLFLFSFIVISLIVFRSSAPKGAKHETTLENTNTAKNRAESLKSKAQIASTEHKMSSFINEGNNQKKSRSHHHSFQDLSGSQTAEQKIAKLKKATFATNWGKESDPDLRAFSRWADNYSRTAPGSRSIMIGQGITLAQARRKVMAQLIAHDPAQAIASAIPATLQLKLPVEILQYAEQTISGIGNLNVYGKTHGPDEDNLTSSFIRRAYINGKKYKATLQGPLASIGTQSDVQLEGVEIEGHAALTGILKTRSESKAQYPYSMTSEPIDRAYCSLGADKKMLVVQVDFTDMEGSEIDREDLKHNLKYVNSYYKSISQGMFAFERIRVVPSILRLPRTSKYYAQDNYEELWRDAMNAAKKVGAEYDSDQYEFAGVSFRKIYSDWAGLATLGAKKFWLNGEWGTHPMVIAHEIGHNLGLLHAAAWDPASISQADDPRGEHLEYGNVFDLMGGGSGNDRFKYPLHRTPISIHFRELLGWIPQKSVLTVTNSWSGRLFTSDSTLSGDRHYAIRIDANRNLGGKNNLDYWIEYRSSLPGNHYVANGALIYLSDPKGSGSQDSSSCRLLDMNPITRTMTDAPLQKGYSFADTKKRWKISVTGQGGKGSNSFLDITIIKLPIVSKGIGGFTRNDKVFYGRDPRQPKSQLSLNHNPKNPVASKLLKSESNQTISGNPKSIKVNGRLAHPTRVLAKVRQNVGNETLCKSLEEIGCAEHSKPNEAGWFTVVLPPKKRLKGEGQPIDADRHWATGTEALKNTGVIQSIEPDYIIQLSGAPNDSAFTDGKLWGLRNTGQSRGTPGIDIGAVAAWDKTTGSTNVIVAVIDTGIRYTHQDLAAQMWRNPGEIAGNGIDDDGDGWVDNVYGIDAVNNDGDPNDGHGHGTHCAGTIGAAANDGNPHVGVTWKVQLMACKIFKDDGGFGFNSDVVESVDFAVINGAKILSNSWGGGAPSGAIYDSIERARDAGVIFIAAAGNDNEDTDANPHYPSSYNLANIISVAAVDRNGERASFSNYGSTSVDLGAPGVSIYSSISTSDSSYAYYDGTSMAAPHVSGVAALLLAQDSTMGHALLKSKIMDTTVPLSSLNGKTVTGGMVNAANALAAMPSITSHPSNLTISVGESATFSVVATGKTPLSYQWQKDNSNIPNATNSSYTINVTSSNDAGSYRCVISNTYGTVTSNAATLTFSKIPTIITHPTSQNAIVGTSPHFTVTATGSDPLSFQWQKDNIDIPGATNSTYSISNAQTDDNGFYRCIVENAFGSATSNTAELLVGYAPAINSHPVSADQVARSSVTFSISLAAGSTPLTYQWQKNSVNISGATSISYTISSLASDDNGSYRCVATNPFGTAISNAATLIVGTAPAVSTQPVDQNAIAGTSPTFSVTTTGTPPLSYQWQKDGSNITGATSSSYTIENVQIDANGATYRCYITNKYGFITSSSATLAVGYVPAFASHPISADKIIGSSYTFSVSLSEGTDPISYQWQKDGTDISGANSASYTIEVLSAEDEGVYSCIASNVFGSTTSNTATLTVGIPPTISSQPADLNATIGSNPTFIVTATGTAPLSYQWQMNGVHISNATNSSYTITDVTTKDIGNYRCIISNKYATTYSDYAALDVGTAPSIWTSPISKTTLSGKRTTFSAGALGSPELSYQWQKDNSNVSGSHTLRLAKHYPQYNSKKYKWFKSIDGHWVFIVPHGEMHHKMITTTITGATRETRKAHNIDNYFWNNPWALVGRSFLTIEGTDSSHSGDYRCIIHNRFGSAVSSVATLTVAEPPSISSQPVSVDEIVGENATFTLTATGAGTLNYQWQKNGVNIDGATKSSYTIESVEIADAGLYRCIVSNLNGTVTSVDARLTVGLAPTINSDPTSQASNAGDTVTFSISASASGSVTYQWQKDGVDIDNASGLILKQYFPQFDNTDRKWILDNSGQWHLLYNTGVLKNYLSGEITGNFGADSWDNPWKLLGSNHFTIRSVAASDAGKYRCKVSNAGTTLSKEVTLTINP